MKLKVKFWLKLSLLNLCIVALLGVLMRYKIGFEFLYFEQINLQHSHSHFAFSGWISHTLMTLMVFYLQTKIVDFNGGKYRKYIIANLICSYGMLFFFIIEGYGFISILFSTASLVVSYVFGYQFIKDLKLLDNDLCSKNWFKAAIFFNIISSIGTYYLGYIMATKSILQDLYLSSVYYYLHFQYNGWFFFASMGLFLGFLNIKKSDHPFFATAFKLFTIACFPVYFLSLLWLDLPMWLYLITVIGALVQVITWFKLLLVVLKTHKNILMNLAPLLKTILVFISFALSIKLVLQLGSTVPYISQLAFGFRPIVIAYLHLVLLAIISLFIIFYSIANHLFVSTKKMKIGIILFLIGVILNETALAIQGVASFSYTSIPNINYILFAIAIVLFLGIGITTYYSLKKGKNYPPL